MPHDPQSSGSFCRSAQVAPHTVFPEGHVQAPATQKSPAGQATAHDPQWFGSDDTLTQPTAEPQLTSPAGHWHTPLSHVALGPHWLPHAPQPPQLFTKALVSTSHPLAGSPSQLAKPGLQLPSPQVPAVQTAVPLGSAGQTWPQAPQLFTSSLTSTSQPFAGLPSQLTKPPLQAPRPQVPAVQVAVMFGSVGHTWPHAPQLFTSLLVLDPHPLVGQTPPATQIGSVVPG
jgi:hypothetical protein